MKNNIFENIPTVSGKELIEVLLNKNDILIERIVSFGFHSQEGFWYNQDKDEWVILLTGEAEIEFRDETQIRMKSGDYLLIPAHQEHRITYTSKEPNCNWLAFHF